MAFVYPPFQIRTVWVFPSDLRSSSETTLALNSTHSPTERALASVTVGVNSEHSSADAVTQQKLRPAANEKRKTINFQSKMNRFNFCPCEKS
jgi:hypothetical protein